MNTISRIESNLSIIRVLVSEPPQIVRILVPGPPGPAGQGLASVLASGGDDAGAIQAALDGAMAAGNIGVFLSSSAPYHLSVPLRPPPGIELRGRGGGQYPPSAFVDSPTFLSTVKTRIVALPGFPANEPFIKVAANPGDAYACQAVSVRGMMLDCAGIAARGLDVISTKNSAFEDLLIFRSTSIGVLEDCLPQAQSGTAQAGSGSTITLQITASTRDGLYVGLAITITAGTGNGQTRTISAYDGANQIATVSVAWTMIPDATSAYSIASGSVTEGNGASQFNTFRRMTVWLGPTGSARGWVQTGNPTNNINQCHYERIKIVHADGDGIVMENADSNGWYGVDTHAFGNGYGCRLKGNHKNSTEYARNIMMFGTQFAGPGAGRGGILVENGNLVRSSTPGVRPSVFNTISGYSTGNGAPLPEIEDNAQLDYFTDRYNYFSDNAEAIFYTRHTNQFITGAHASWRHLGKLGDGTEHELGRVVARMAGAAGAEELNWDFWGWKAGSEQLLASFGAMTGFTPVLTFGGGNVGMSITLTGSYTLLGGVALIHIGGTFSAKGSSNGAVTIDISNSGFTSASGSAFALSMDDLNAAVGGAMLSCIIPANSQTLLLSKLVSGNRVTLTAADFTDTTSFAIDGRLVIA